MKKFTTRTYRDEKQLNKEAKKLAKKGFKVLNVNIENGKYQAEYQTRP